jgi:beta-phosphoglucomutase-like phosphatase (HAD superfamily)
VAAAADLGAAPSKSVVLEDAISGVRAGAAGGFALVIGVDRGVGEAALAEAGAGLVVTDLGELL